MGERTTEFVLGLIGGIMGFFGGILMLLVGKIIGFFGIEGASMISDTAYVGLFFCALGIFGAALVKDKPKAGGIFMIVSALGGVIFLGIYYGLSFILLLTAGLMGVIKKKSIEEKKKEKISKIEVKKVNWVLCLIMSILFGTFGVDRFMMGKVGTGILKLITAGGCGVWWVVDIILIAIKYKYSGVKWV